MVYEIILLFEAVSYIVYTNCIFGNLPSVTILQYFEILYFIDALHHTDEYENRTREASVDSPFRILPRWKIIKKLQKTYNTQLRQSFAYLHKIANTIRECPLSDIESEIYETDFAPEILF